MLRKPEIIICYFACPTASSLLIHLFSSPQKNTARDAYGKLINKQQSRGREESLISWTGLKSKTTSEFLFWTKYGFSSTQIPVCGCTRNTRWISFLNAATYYSSCCAEQTNYYLKLWIIKSSRRKKTLYCMRFQFTGLSPVNINKRIFSFEVGMIISSYSTVVRNHNRK